MSLDIYLKIKTQEDCVHCKGNCHPEEVYQANITHNLTQMADKAGIYEALWRPEEIQKKKAKELMPLLEKGLENLKKRPAYFQKFDSSNGWGTYEHFVPFVEKYLEACREYPDSTIEVWR